jgi:hypothetical protein
MKQLTVWGAVNEDGTRKAGTGFKPERDKKGRYTVKFDPDTFASMPSVVTLENCSTGWEDFESDGCDGRNNTVLIAVNKDKFKIKTGNHGGDPIDRNFTFIAVGESAKIIDPLPPDPPPPDPNGNGRNGD